MSDIGYIFNRRMVRRRKEEDNALEERRFKLHCLALIGNVHLSISMKSMSLP